MSDFARYIGIPWAAGAIGPDAYDCMAFVRMVQAEHFGVDMPEIAIPDYDDSRGLVGLMNGHGELANWAPVKQPRHGDGVLIRTPMHYGVWLDLDGGGVLHCVRGAGVVFTKDAHWQMSGLGRRQYLRHRSKL